MDAWIDSLMGIFQEKLCHMWSVHFQDGPQNLHLMVPRNFPLPTLVKLRCVAMGTGLLQPSLKHN